LFLFPSEKIISLTDLFYDDMFGWKRLEEPDGRTFRYMQ
jgi:hypothetical protein